MRKNKKEKRQRDGRVGLILGTSGGVGAASGIGGFFGSRKHITNSLANRDIKSSIKDLKDVYTLNKKKLIDYNKVLINDEHNTRKAINNIAKRIDYVNNNKPKGFKADIRQLNNAYDAYDNKLNSLLNKKSLVKKNIKLLKPRLNEGIKLLKDNRSQIAKGYRSVANKKALISAAIIGLGIGGATSLLTNAITRE